MSFKRPLAPLAVLLTGMVLAPSLVTPAQAELGATGTRLQVPGGPARFYMTYGHIEDQELFAPLVPELQRLGVTIRLEGKHYAFYKQGEKIAEWPFVTNRDDVPETGEDPVVLSMGGNIFLPVRGVCELLNLDIKWQKRDNLVSMVPGGVKRPPVAAKPTLPNHNPQGEPVAARPQVTVSGVEFAETQFGLEVRIKADGQLYPEWNTVQNRAILFIDLPGARWTKSATAPEARGVVKAARVGHPDGTKARLALDVPSTSYRVISMRRDGNDVVAIVGQGLKISSRPLGNPPAAPLQIAKNDVPPPFRPGKPKQRPFRQGRSLTPVTLIGTALLGKTICIDAGHGGHSSGAKGLFSLEKDHCLAMSQRVKDALESCGAKVVMTRNSDTYVSLEDRCQFAIANNADLFISIHCNSTPTRNSASGSQTYYTTPQSVPLAQALHDRMLAATGVKDGGIRTCRFYVCRNVPMPSVLLEIAFINNAQEEKLLSSPQLHNDLAGHLAMGVIEYFQYKNNGSLGGGGEVIPLPDQE